MKTKIEPEFPSAYRFILKNSLHFRTGSSILRKRSWLRLNSPIRRFVLDWRQFWIRCVEIRLEGNSWLCWQILCQDHPNCLWSLIWRAWFQSQRFDDGLKILRVVTFLSKLKIITFSLLMLKKRFDGGFSLSNLEEFDEDS